MEHYGIIKQNNMKRGILMLDNLIVLLSSVVISSLISSLIVKLRLLLSCL